MVCDKQSFIKSARHVSCTMGRSPEEAPGRMCRSQHEIGFEKKVGTYVANEPWDAPISIMRRPII